MRAARDDRRRDHGDADGLQHDRGQPRHRVIGRAEATRTPRAGALSPAAGSLPRRSVRPARPGAGATDQRLAQVASHGDRGGQPPAGNHRHFGHEVRSRAFVEQGTGSGGLKRKRSDSSRRFP